MSGSKLTPRLMTTTLWDFPSQHYGNREQGDKNFAGVTPSYVIWNILQRYSKPGDKVLDPMCGSGTTLDVCRDLGRKGIGFDVAPVRNDILKGDARHLRIDAASIDLVFVDPPYSTHIKYSTDRDCVGELDARQDEYYNAMDLVIAEIHRVLKPGGYFALYVSDSYSKNKPFVPIGFELFLRMTRLFDVVDIISVARHNRSLKRNHWHTAAIEGNYFLRGFNYLFVVRKMPLRSSSRHAHDKTGCLSELWKASADKSGKVVTPEEFSEILSRDQKVLKDQAHRSKHRTPHGPGPKANDTARARRQRSRTRNRKHEKRRSAEP